MFVKFSDIEQTKNVTLEDLSKFALNHVQVTEKLDGTNRSICIGGKDEPVEIYTRYGETVNPEDTEFIRPMLEALRNHLNLGSDKLILFGELFGKTIMKRMDYKERKDFVVFSGAFAHADGSIDRYLPCSDLERLLEGTGLKVIPSRLVSFSLDSLEKDFPLNVVSQYAETSTIEGYVFGFFSKDNPRLITKYLKFKDERFADRKTLFVPLTPEEQAVKDRTDAIREEFYGYLTENRILDMISKLGGDASKIKAGQLTAMVIKDAASDYQKDHPDAFDGLSKADTKKAFKVGDRLFAMVTKVLSDQNS